MVYEVNEFCCWNKSTLGAVGARRFSFVFRARTAAASASAAAGVDDLSMVRHHLQRQAINHHHTTPRPGFASVCAGRDGGSPPQSVSQPRTKRRRLYGLATLWLRFTEFYCQFSGFFKFTHTPPGQLNLVCMFFFCPTPHYYPS